MRRHHSTIKSYDIIQVYEKYRRHFSKSPPEGTSVPSFAVPKPPHGETPRHEPVESLVLGLPTRLRSPPGCCLFSGNRSSPGARAERARRERHDSPPRKAPDSDDAPLRGAKTSFISGRLAAAGKRRSRRKHGPSSADSPKDSIPGSGGLEAASGMKTSLSPCPGAPCPARRQQKSPSEQNPTGLKGGAERLSAASWRC